MPRQSVIDMLTLRVPSYIPYIVGSEILIATNPMRLAAFAISEYVKSQMKSFKYKND